MRHPPTLLVLDTSTPQAVAGVVRGTDVLSMQCADAPRAPSEGILPMLQHCLQEASLGIGDVDALAVGRGPGSFTGTRIAVSTAKGIALGAHTAVVSVSSLEALALGARGRRVAVALDARKGEVLLGTYRQSRERIQVRTTDLDIRLARPITAPSLMPPGESLQVLDRLRQEGEAVLVVEDSVREALQARPESGLRVTDPATVLASGPLALAWLALDRMARGEQDDPDHVEPVYSRPPPVSAAGPRSD